MVYCPEKCCLVPNLINDIFTKKQNKRGKYCIGVYKNGKLFGTSLRVKNKPQYLGSYATEQEAFVVYKEAKEDYIKQIAKEEYSKGNITKQCYNAMMNYSVEKTD